jgi:hypothetical protein
MKKIREPEWIWHTDPRTGKDFLRLEYVEAKQAIKLTHVILIILFIVGPVGLASICQASGGGLW